MPFYASVEVGTRCLDCTDVLKPSDCKKVKLCSQDSVGLDITFVLLVAHRIRLVLIFTFVLFVAHGNR